MCRASARINGAFSAFRTTYSCGARRGPGPPKGGGEGPGSPTRSERSSLVLLNISGVQRSIRLKRCRAVTTKRRSMSSLIAARSRHSPRSRARARPIPCAARISGDRAERPRRDVARLAGGRWHLALHSYRESAVSNRRLPLTSRRLDNDRQPACANGVAMSRSAAPNTGQLKAVGST